MYLWENRDRYCSLRIRPHATPAKAIWVGWPELKKITTGVTVIIIIIITIGREFDLEYQLWMDGSHILKSLKFCSSVLPTTHRRLFQLVFEINSGFHKRARLKSHARRRKKRERSETVAAVTIAAVFSELHRRKKRESSEGFFTVDDVVFFAPEFHKGNPRRILVEGLI